MTEIWNGNALHGFSDVRRKLPAHKQSLTQLGRGRLEARATVVSGSDATIYVSTIGTHCTTQIELESNYTGIVVPLRWRGELALNGEQVRPCNLYFPQEKILFQAHGTERTFLGITMPRQEFIATVAALQGIAPDDVQLDAGALELSSAVMMGARRLLSKLIDQCINAPDQRPQAECSAEQLTRRITQILINLYLPARPAKPAVPNARNLTRIVQVAEERFAEAQAGPVSLADLCVAAGVSQVTLCHAFMVVCGSSPMAYFKKRRLTDARLALICGEPETGLVKRAALEAGITHMGRFSAEYQQLFGELPTTTLNRVRP